MAKNTDQIKRLDNEVTLAGVLAELEPMKEGEKDGVKWLSFRGVVQCGKSRDNNVDFRVFARELNSKGEKSKVYINAKKWYKEAVSLVKCGGNENEATWFEGVGSILDNMYWSDRNQRVAEGHTFNISLFNEFSEYKATIGLTGYVNSLVDEALKNDPDTTTGRQRFTMLSRDMYSNIIKMDFIVPNTQVLPDGVDNMVQAFSDHDIDKGTTFKVYAEMIPRRSKSNSGGVGITGGKSSYREWVVIGFNDVDYKDEENAISTQMARKMLNERQIKMDGITAETPNGTPVKHDSGAVVGHTGGSKSRSYDEDEEEEEVKPVKKTKKPVTDSPYSDEDFDDMPF